MILTKQHTAITSIIDFNQSEFLPQIRFPDPQGQKQFNGVVDNLDPTEDGEAGEESHGATDEAELGLQGHLHILLYLVICGRVKVDLYQLQGRILEDTNWNYKILSFLKTDVYLGWQNLNQT